MSERLRRNRTAIVFTVILAAGLAAAGALTLAGCDDTKGKEKSFKSDWTGIVEELNARIARDDKKGQDLVAKDDLAGVIALTRKRVEHIDEVLGKMLELYPPRDLRKLDALSIYYLVTLKDRLEQQISLYEAILNGRPTADLETVLEQLTARSQTIGRELGIEIQKEGITLKEGAQETYPSTSPSTSPSEQP